MASSDIYKDYLSKPSLVKNIFTEFTKTFFVNTFHSNSDLLFDNSKLINFNRDLWRLRPDVFCRDYYNQYEFYPIILLVNNIPSRFCFDETHLPNGIIIAPLKDNIEKIIQFKTI